MKSIKFLIFTIITIVFFSIGISGYFIYKSIFPSTIYINLNIDPKNINEMYVDYHTNRPDPEPEEKDNNFTLSKPNQIEYSYEKLGLVKMFKKPVKKTIDINDLREYFYLQIKYTDDEGKNKQINLAFYNYKEAEAFITIDDVTYQDYYNLNLVFYNDLINASLM